MNTTLEIIDIEIARLQRERKKVENASLFIKELKALKKEMNKDKDILIGWQQGLKTKYLGLGMTMRDLGNKIGVSYQTINKWVNRYNVIPKRRASQLSILLNYPLPKEIDIPLP